MKLTKQNIEQADQIQKVANADELPQDSFLGRRIYTMVKYHGFYGYTKEGKKILVVTESCYNGLVN